MLRRTLFPGAVHTLQSLTDKRSVSFTLRCEVRAVDIFL
jgi:hypothetical protein